jgi:hypothetical protein
MAEGRFQIYFIRSFISLISLYLRCHSFSFVKKSKKIRVTLVTLSSALFHFVLEFDPIERINQVAIFCSRRLFYHKKVLRIGRLFF